MSRFRGALPLVALLVLVLPAHAQPAAPLEIQAVRGGIQMISGGNAGNVGVCIGKDGVFLIDDKFAPLAPRIRGLVDTVSKDPVRFLVNTHWHGDHTGGNEAFGKNGAVIVAHENVRKRLSTEQFVAFFNRTVPPSPEAALPVITFAEGVTFHWNGEEIRVQHVANAHTDGDAVVHFAKADVIHTGDVYFNGLYPFVDVACGGSVRGMIAAADRLLAMTKAETKIIPGHGPLAGPDELRDFRAMLATSVERVAALIAEGKDADAVVAAAPTRDLDGRWGKGFLKPEAWVRIVYESEKAGAR